LALVNNDNAPENINVNTSKTPIIIAAERLDSEPLVKCQSRYTGTIKRARIIARIIMDTIVSMRLLLYRTIPLSFEFVFSRSSGEQNKYYRQNVYNHSHISAEHSQ
jgi:hypothetical protein